MFEFIHRQAVEDVGSIYTGVGRWGRRIFLDEKNWIEVKAAGTIAADVCKFYFLFFRELTVNIFFHVVNFF